MNVEINKIVEGRVQQTTIDFFQEKLPAGYKLKDVSKIPDYDMWDHELIKYNPDSPLGIGEVFGGKGIGLVKTEPTGSRICRISLDEQELTPEEQEELVNDFLGELAEEYADEFNQEVIIKYQRYEDSDGSEERKLEKVSTTYSPFASE
jgi:hypothetical protein